MASFSELSRENSSLPNFPIDEQNSHAPTVLASWPAQHGQWSTFHGTKVTTSFSSASLPGQESIDRNVIETSETTPTIRSGQVRHLEIPRGECSFCASESSHARPHG